MSTARKSLGLIGLAAVLLLCWAGTSYAAMLVNENFDSMGSAPGTSSAPAGWTVGYLGSVGSQNRLAMSPYAGNGQAITGMTIYSVAAIGGSPVLDYRTNYYGGTLADQGHVYNCGVIDAADRALGNYPRTNPSGDHVMQVAFSNTTGVTITGIHLEYDMEQWSRSQGTPPSPELIRVLLSSTSATTGFDYLGTAFDGVAPLPGAVGTPYPVINGNTVGNFVHVSGDYTLPSALAPGASMWLRFHDWNDNATSDIVLAIDNVQLTGIPEPATMALLALGGLALLRKRTKR